MNSSLILRSTQAIAVIAALLLSQFAFIQFAFAATDYASTVESYTPGTQKNGSPVAVNRSDPSEALGVPDGTFVSLGYDGELILGFPTAMSGNLMVSVFETTNAPYPLETAQVAVSNSSTGPWTVVGTADNTASSTSLAVGQCYQYVRLIDTTDETLHNATSDGFDVDAVEATYDTEGCGVEPEPQPQDGGQGDVIINSGSNAVVINETSAEASTGGNYAGGSTGGNGGAGGGISGDGGSQDVNNATLGSGGNGGNGGAGGLVTTGDATANASTSNIVNTTDIDVNDCACDNATSTSGDVRIRTRSNAFVINGTYAVARTGHNYAEGSTGGSGGRGGSISATGGEGDGQEIDDVTTGNGGQGGLGDIGGEVSSGVANSTASTENIVNRTRVRVSR